MTLLVHKHLDELFELLLTCVRFLFTGCHLIVHRFLKPFNKKKLN